MANVSQWQASGNRTRLAVFCLIGLVWVTSVTGVGCKKADASAHDHDDDPAGTADKGILHLEPFVVNLADAEENRFLRVGVDLGLAKPLADKESAADVARARDSIILVLSTWRSDALLASDGKQKLKEEMLHSLQDRVPELGVKEIYFTDFLVQR